MSRYPHTHAADMIRCSPSIELGPNGVKLSRHEAFGLIDQLSEAIGIDKEELTTKLAAYFVDNELIYAEATLAKWAKKRM